MKHWNKNPELRKTWHSVTVDAGGYRNYYTFDKSAYEAKRWCWQHQSPGRFYINLFHLYREYQVMFEREEDAMWFRLSWMK